MNTASLENLQLFSIDTLIDPYDAYARLRDEAPVFHAADLNLHVVTRYDLVREAIKENLKRYFEDATTFVKKRKRQTDESDDNETWEQSDEVEDEDE